MAFDYAEVDMMVMVKSTKHITLKMKISTYAEIDSDGDGTVDETIESYIVEYDSDDNVIYEAYDYDGDGNPEEAYTYEYRWRDDILLSNLRLG